MTHDSYFSSLGGLPENESVRWPDDGELAHLAEEALELARCERVGEDGPMIRRYIVWDDVYQEY